MGTAVSRPEPRRSSIESEIDDDDDEFDDDEDFSPSELNSQSIFATAAAATKPERNVAATTQIGSLLDHPDNGGTINYQERRPSESRSQQPTKPDSRTTVVEGTAFPNHLVRTVRTMVDNVSEGCLPFAIQSNTNLLGRKTKLLGRKLEIDSCTSTRKKRQRLVDSTATPLQKMKAKRPRRAIRPGQQKVDSTKAVTPVRKIHRVENTTISASPRTISMFPANTTKQRNKQDDNKDDKFKFREQIASKQSATKINENRWSEEDAEPILATGGKSHGGGNRWDYDDEVPIIKSSILRTSTRQKDMRARPPRTTGLTWTNEDLKPFLKSDEETACKSMRPTSPQQLKRMFNGSDPLARGSQQVDALQWRKEDEEPIMKVLGLVKNAAVAGGDAVTASTSEAETSILDVEDLVATAAYDEAFIIEQSSRERPRLSNMATNRSNKNQHLKRRRRTNKLDGDSKPGPHAIDHHGGTATSHFHHDSLFACSPQKALVGEISLLGEKETWESDDRDRTIWTAARDETLCIAIALQSQNDAVDWEEIRHAVGASSICSVQHRWVRVKHRQPTAKLLRVMIELSIPSWPIELRDKWTKAEIKLLYELVESFTDLHYEDKWGEISRRMGRTVNAVQAKFTRMNKKLAKEKNELSGTMKGARHRRHIRTDFGTTPAPTKEST